MWPPFMPTCNRPNAGYAWFFLGGLAVSIRNAHVGRVCVRACVHRVLCARVYKRLRL